MGDFVLYIHLAFLLVAVAGIAWADETALRWVLGKRESIPLARSNLFHNIVTTGLVGLVLSGIYLFWPMRDYLLSNPLFWLKMLFVAVLLVNSFAIDKLSTAALQPFNTLSAKQKLPLMLSGAASALSWLGAIVAAFLLFGWPF